MFAKIEITGNIEVLTGMHIGGSNSYSAIGSVCISEVPIHILPSVR